MKNLSIIIGIFCLIFLASCSKVNNKEMTVIKDCTGSYLRYNGDDYLICNDEIVKNINNNTEVTASFKKIDNCEIEKSACMMLHENEGSIDVLDIE